MNIFKALAIAVAALAALRAEAASSAADYVQDGLVMHLDGIENVGLGLEHDSSATTWTDLTGNGFDWTINLSAATWQDTGLHFNGNGYPGTTTKTAADLQNKITTIEFVYRNEVKADTIIFATGMGRTVYLYTDDTAQVGVYDFKGYAAPFGSTNTYSVTYNRTGANPAGVKALYVNGAFENPVTMGDYWNFSDTTCMLGNRPTGSSLPAKGILMALRVYSRELTTAERMANLQVDHARFGTTYTVPTYTITAQAAAGGAMSINGGTASATAAATIEEGDEVSVTAVDTDAAKFLMWASGTVADSNLTARTITFTVDRSRTLQAIFNPTTGGGDERIMAYSRDGLLDMWDGISNVSLTNAHDDASTVWKDLVATRHLTISSANATVVSNALACLGTGNGAAASSAQTNYQTIEIVMDPASTTAEQFVFCGGANMRLVATSPSAAYMLGGANQGAFYFTGKDPATFAFTYSSSGVSAFYEGGAKKTLTSGTCGWGNVPGVVNIGSRNGEYCYKGNLYAIRLYSRVLTEAELAKHAAVDSERFFGKTGKDAATIDVRGGGKVSIDGGEAAAVQTIELTYGSVLQFTAVPDEGMEFVAWEAEDVTLSGTNIVAGTLNMAISAGFKHLRAVFLPKEGRVDRRVTDYSYDGILGMWDGICNVGYGYAHDAGTNVWKDLVGTRDLPLVTGGGAFTENALECLSRSSGISAGPALALEGIKSYEIVCDRDKYSYALNWGSGPFVAFNAWRVMNHTPGILYDLTTNVATLAFVYDSSFGWLVYENGAEVMTRGLSDTWAVQGQMTLGSSLNYTASYLYTGRIFAVRAYDRALTPVEVVKHSDLDQKRFFDCEKVESDRGVRVLEDGTVECLLRVTASGPGTITVDGKTVASGDFWYPQGTSVTLTAQPSSDVSFLGWIDDDRRVVTSAAAYGETSVTVSVTRKTLVGAAFVRNRVLRRASAASYAQSGLTAHWDGRENAGLGKAHDASATNWVDLTGNGRIWALETKTNACWSAQGLILTGKGLAGSFASGAPALASNCDRTTEFVYATGTKRNGIVFTLGANKVRIYTDLNGHVGFRAFGPGEKFYGYAAALGSTNSYSVVNEVDVFDWFAVNGAPRANNGMADYWSKNTGLTEIGAMSDGAGTGVHGDGEILAIRLYNRRLTGAERLLNAQLDAIRYLGATVPRAPGLVLSLR